MPTPRNTKDSIHDTADEIGATAGEAAADVKDEFHRLGSKLRANGSQLEDDLYDAGQRFAEGARKFSEAAAEQIREHPVAAFGVAFAAGMVITRWLRGR